jgi:hypothetical protein
MRGEKKAAQRRIGNAEGPRNRHQSNFAERNRSENRGRQMKKKETNIIIKLTLLIIVVVLTGRGIQAQVPGQRPQPTPPAPSGISVRDTMLYHLFDKYPYDTKKPFAVQYPRVALTIITAPPNHAEHDVIQYTGGRLPAYGCFTLSAKVWSSAKQSQTVGPFHWCSPQDLPKDYLPENRATIVPCDGCGPILLNLA